MTGRRATNTGGATARRSRADVVATALQLLDEGGLAGLSMRNIAGALSLQVSALYWHFPNKQSILAAVADEILAPLSATPTSATPASPTPASPTPASPTPSSPDPGPSAPAWRTATIDACLSLREALLAVTDGAEVVASTLALGLGERDPAQTIERALESRASGGLERTTSTAVTAGTARTIVTYVLGHTQHWQQRRLAERLGIAGPSAVDERSDFIDGVTLLLDGVAARERLASAPRED